jgi:hypothetical protein
MTHQGEANDREHIWYSRENDRLNVVYLLKSFADGERRDVDPEGAALEF